MISSLPLPSSISLHLTRESMQTYSWVFLSIFSSVALVSINKAMFQTPLWSFHTILVCAHLAATHLYTRVFAALGYYDASARITVPQTRMLLDAALLSLSILSMNWTLDTNTVSFYQLTKLLIVPAQVVLSSHDTRSWPPRDLMGSLGLLLLGLVAVFVTDVSTTFLGLCCASIALVSTTWGQRNVQRTQAQYGVPSLLYLRHISFYQMCMMAVAAVLTDLPRFTMAPFLADFTFPCLFLASCFLAFLVNASSMVIIGKLSALTYQVIGHSKTVLVLAVGFLVFGNPLSFRGAVGLAVAGAGVWWYTAIKLRPAGAAPSTNPSSSTPAAAAAGTGTGTAVAMVAVGSNSGLGLSSSRPDSESNLDKDAHSDSLSSGVSPLKP